MDDVIILPLPASLTALARQWLAHRVCAVIGLRALAATATPVLDGDTIRIACTGMGSKRPGGARQVALSTCRRELRNLDAALPIVAVPFFSTSNDDAACSNINVDELVGRFIGQGGERIKKLRTSLGPNADVLVIAQDRCVLVRLPNTTDPAAAAAAVLRVRNEIDTVVARLQLRWPIDAALLRDTARSARLDELLVSPGAVEAAWALGVVLCRPQPHEIRGEALGPPPGPVDRRAVWCLIQKIKLASQIHSWRVPKTMRRDPAWCERFEACLATDTAVAQALRASGALLVSFNARTDRFVQYCQISIDIVLEVNSVARLFRELAKKSAQAPQQLQQQFVQSASLLPDHAIVRLAPAVQKARRAIGRVLSLALDRRGEATKGDPRMLIDLMPLQAPTNCRELHLQDRLRARALRKLRRKNAANASTRPETFWWPQEKKVFSEKTANFSHFRFARTLLRPEAGGFHAPGRARHNNSLSSARYTRSPVSMHLWIEPMLVGWRSAPRVVAMSLKAAALRPSGVPFPFVSLSTNNYMTLY